MWRVESSFLLNPTLNTSPKLDLQKVLPYRHPCHTWDPCEVAISPNFPCSLNGWDCTVWSRVTWDFIRTWDPTWNFIGIISFISYVWACEVTWHHGTGVTSGWTKLGHVTRHHFVVHVDRAVHLSDPFANSSCFLYSVLSLGYENGIKVHFVFDFQSHLSFAVNGEKFEPTLSWSSLLLYNQPVNHS